MFNFLVKKLDNFKFSTDELIDYYNSVETDYDHLRWKAKGTVVDNVEHSVSQLSGWAIQTNFKNPIGVICPYDIVVLRDDDLIDESSNYQKKTKLAFGIAEKIIEAVPYASMMSIVDHPPTTALKEHKDYDIFLKVHIPIRTNDQSYFIFGEEKFVLEVGSAYLINTTELHKTDNQGSTSRTHMIFRIPIEQINNFLSAEFTI